MKVEKVRALLPDFDYKELETLAGIARPHAFNIMKKVKSGALFYLAYRDDGSASVYEIQQVGQKRQGQAEPGVKLIKDRQK